MANNRSSVPNNSTSPVTRSSERRLEKRKLPEAVSTKNSTAADPKKSKQKTQAEYDAEFYELCEKKQQEYRLRAHTSQTPKTTQTSQESPQLTSHQSHKYIKPPTLRIDTATVSPDATDSTCEDLSFGTPTGDLLTDSQPFMEMAPTPTQDRGEVVAEAEEAGGSNFPVNKPNFPTGHRGHGRHDSIGSIDVGLEERRTENTIMGSVATISDIRDILRTQLEGVARASDITIVSEDLRSIGQQVSEVRSQVQTNADDIAQLRGVVEKLQEEATPTRQQRNGERTSSDGGLGGSESSSAGSLVTLDRNRDILGDFLAGARTLQQENARRAKYEESRRTLRIWPISGHTEAQLQKELDSFLRGALLMTTSEIEALGIDSITRTRTQPGMRVHNEVRVSFHHYGERDLLARKGNLLATYVDEDSKPLEGIRMDIPDYLGADFRTLQNYGIKMRSIHGQDTRKYIKFDEPALGIFLELRLPGDTNWIKITPAAARELDDSSDREEIDRNRKKLTARRVMLPPSANFIPVGPRRPRPLGPTGHSVTTPVNIAPHGGPTESRTTTAGPTGNRHRAARSHKNRWDRLGAQEANRRKRGSKRYRSGHGSRNEISN